MGNTRAGYGKDQLKINEFQYIRNMRADRDSHHRQEEKDRLNIPLNLPDSECLTIISCSEEMADMIIGIENNRTEFEKEDDSERSISSNDDFEIIGGQARISEDAASGDGKSNDPLIDLFKKHVVKRHVRTSSHDLQRERAVKSPMLTCATKISNGEEIFEENEHRNETLEETIIEQQEIIEKLEKQLKSCAPLDDYSLPVRVEEERANAFERKDGFNYFFVIVDWKKSDRGIAQQHLHLAFKQSNSSIYVYDHGPLSGRYFTVGDRIIDIDGITFIKAADLRDRILWSHHNKDHFTSIIERPATEQAVRTVSTLLQPSLSTFSVILSV
ncbi:unnamed protein product [Cercopithifilaria johnstoni]|uniref:Uncharacterized protein n=1 Tax=Cercopithifilaria johnstoni TaxID=2874296 RepID=A0A8J2Q931_9BILA|nr:unnamed protein product [Cercopithifilaria johnstoni]